MDCCFVQLRELTMMVGFWKVYETVASNSMVHLAWPGFVEVDTTTAATFRVLYCS